MYGHSVPNGYSGDPGKGVRVARSTKSPSHKLPNGVAAARKLLSEAEVLERLRLDEDALATLRQCCSLRPPRNAGAIVAAIKARLEFSQPKPATKVEHQGNVRIEVVNPYAKPEGT